MKTNKYYILSFLLLTLFVNVSCDEEVDTFKTYDGETLISFQKSSFDLSIPEEDLTLNIAVFASTVSASSRTFDAAITSATEGTAGEYTLGTVTIPANEYEGVFTVDFDFSEIGGDDGDVKELVISLMPPAGVGSYNDVATINYFREIVCNDLTIEIVSDVWATETYWSLRDSAGTFLVDRFFPFGGNSTSPQTYTLDFPLINGDYSLEIGDVFGDGMVGTGGGVTLTGTYALTC
uniref:hypothetical protein n=1 Tax=Winogradskyella sp. TaxID=1883156 RepID=UPI0025D41371